MNAYAFSGQLWWIFMTSPALLTRTYCRRAWLWPMHVNTWVSLKGDKRGRRPITVLRPETPAEEQLNQFCWIAGRNIFTEASLLQQKSFVDITRDAQIQIPVSGIGTDTGAKYSTCTCKISSLVSCILWLYWPNFNLKQEMETLKKTQVVFSSCGPRPLSWQKDYTRVFMAKCCASCRHGNTRPDCL